MTPRRRRLWTVVGAGVAFAGGLAVALAARAGRGAEGVPGSTSPVASLLGLDAQRAAAIDGVDPDFSSGLARLREELDDARAALAAAFDDPATTDDQLRARVEATIEASNRLERHVANYLIAIRHQLTPSEQKKLLGRCADCVRSGGPKRWGRQRGGGPPDGQGAGPRSGRGPGMGTGRGAGVGVGPGHGGNGRGAGAESSPADGAESESVNTTNHGADGASSSSRGCVHGTPDTYARAVLPSSDWIRGTLSDTLIDRLDRHAEWPGERAPCGRSELAASPTDAPIAAASTGTRCCCRSSCKS